MYDGYNQLRRMAESYRSLYDKLDVTRSLYDKLDSIRSLYDKLDSTARVARLAENNFTSQLTHLHESLRFQLDSYLPARNLFDQLRIERGLLDDSLQRAYRPEFVARVDGMLAGIERGTSLAESFAEAGRLSATNLAAV